MLRMTFELDYFAILNMREDAASIWTVEGARCVDDILQTRFS